MDIANPLDYKQNNGPAGFGSNVPPFETDGPSYGPNCGGETNGDRGLVSTVSRSVGEKERSRFGVDRPAGDLCAFSQLRTSDDCTRPVGTSILSPACLRPFGSRVAIDGQLASNQVGLMSSAHLAVSCYSWGPGRFGPYRVE
uniref:Uncharacterized protein n=1 Tax=Panagrellus redivivus TaxID=6233 RepID=A0A7E4VFG8_PANRE